MTWNDDSHLSEVGVANWDSDSAHGGRNSIPNFGLVRDQKTKQFGYAGVRPQFRDMIGSNPDLTRWEGFPTTLTWHMIGCLSKPTVVGDLVTLARPDSDFAPGNFNCAPMGLGYLLDNNYIGDAHVFYCPTSDGAMPCGAQAPGGGIWPSSGGWRSPIFRSDFTTGGFEPDANIWSARAWKTMGGFDRDAFRYGDYQKYFENMDAEFYAAGTADGTVGTYVAKADQVGRALVVESDYAYRNVPFYLVVPLVPDQDYTYDQVELYNDRHSLVDQVPYTKPMVTWLSGGPMFRTDKLLGGRAIVADGFGSKACSDEDGSSDAGAGQVATTHVSDTVSGSAGDLLSLPQVTMGWYGHRDGYNVLYGDFSTKWFGDPNREILWFMSRFDASDVASGDVTSVGRDPGTASYLIGSSLRGRDSNNVLTTTLTATAYPSGGYKTDAALAAWDARPTPAAADGGGYTDTEMAHLGQTIWHMFDMARNIDVDAGFFNNSN